MTEPSKPWLRNGCMALLLVVMTVVAYWPALHGGFVWDDDVHISDNGALRSLEGLWAIWFKPGATCQYYPLTFTGFWVGYQLWGLNPLGYHLLNVLLHGLVAVLLWQVLARVKVRGAWLAGALFALHPVCVMSAAWMTELKNTLSAALALGAGLAYLRFAGLGTYERADLDSGKVDNPGAGRCWRFYALSLGLFQLALFAKSAVSFLPVSLVLVTWWRARPGRALQWRDVWPLLPMLGLAAGMGKLTFHIEHLFGASGREFNLGFLERGLVSGRAFWFYLGKLFFPCQLTFVYERWQVDAHAVRQYLYPVAMAGVLGWAWWQRRRLGRGLFVALLHFYVCTSLLILLVALYRTRYSFVSDHWQYFGCMSIMAVTAAGITTGLDRFQKGSSFLKPALGSGLLLVLGVLTWRQCGMYTDLETLWRTTLAANPHCSMAHTNLGDLLMHGGKLDEAIIHFHEALEADPDDEVAYNNLGNALLQKGQVTEAIADYRKALELQPDYAKAHYNLGNTLLQQGRVTEAIGHFQRALEIQPDLFEAHNSLGSALLQTSQADEAIAHYQKALELQPDFAEAHYNLGNALLQKGQADEAIAQLQKALEIQPNFAKAHNNMGTALLQRGQANEAITHFRKALAIQPDNAEAHNNLGTALLQRGQANEAITHFRKALAIQPDNAEAHNNLGWLLLQNGHLDEAIAHFQAVLSIQPGIALTHNNLAIALLRKGRAREAIAQYQAFLKMQPDNARILSDLAWVLATWPETSIRNGEQAIDLAQRANQLSGGQDPVILRTLAAAYAEGGQFAEAATTAQRAMQLADAQSDTALGDALRAQVKLYQAGSAFRDPVPMSARAKPGQP